MRSRDAAKIIKEEIEKCKLAKERDMNYWDARISGLHCALIIIEREVKNDKK